MQDAEYADDNRECEGLTPAEAEAAWHEALAQAAGEGDGGWHDDSVWSTGPGPGHDDPEMEGGDR